MVVLSEEAEAQTMASAEKTSAADADARAAETKEKADGCASRRSRGYFVHNPLICGDTISCSDFFYKICVSKAEKETPDSQ